ncbi:MAG TPA: polysaccharide lyase family 8 super-sandwich domain-containing protein, partial [Bacteroidales bacterium]|nr:polysaccharide lyase family 8 super-sandwich domain-containing protein [Bacteroidales bacterium]
AKNLLFTGDYDTFNEIIRIIESEIKYSKWVGAEYGYGYKHIPTGFSNREMGGRGIMYDNSFHHRVDGVNNTLSYGLGYAAAFAEWAVYVADTKYAFSNEKSAQLIDYFLDGICKTAVFGKYPDAGAKNRSISRKGTLHAYDADLPEKLLVVSDYRKDELQEIVDIREKGIKPTTSHATFFWHSEHFSYQRPGWFTSVRMYSQRNHNMEWPYNSEGFLNHHRGDGVNHISVTGDEYYNIWPVYDYQKIPGTTVMQKAGLPEPNAVQKLGETDFVGAVTDGNYGAAAFDFKSPHDPLVARKAWFFFDTEYVCLGAGISCKEDDLPVVTTLNQCLLRDDVTVSFGNQKRILERGESEYNDVDWVFQDGVGYVFPEPASVHIKNDKASGSWWRINKQTDSPKEKITLDVFKIWLDHGKRASNEKYEYIVVPATTKDQLNESKKNIQILSNTPYIQAVKQNELNMYQAVFYKAGEVEINNNFKLVADNPGIVMLKMNGSNVEKISVADPNRELKNFCFSISERLENPGQYLNAVWDKKEKLTHITIRLPQGNYAGGSVTIEL